MSYYHGKFLKAEGSSKVDSLECGYKSSAGVE